MKFRDLLEGYNKEFGQMYYNAKESNDIDQIHGNSDFIIQFDYKGGEYEYTLEDSSSLGIEKAFAKMLNTNKIPIAMNTDTNKIIKNVQLSSCSNFNYEIN